MSDKYFTSDFKETPFWWDEAPRPAAVPRDLPDTTEVLIVGSGYTGLSAALQPGQAWQAGNRSGSRRFRATGASSRNAGACGRTFRFTFGELASRFGTDRAIEIYRELYEAHNFALDLIQEGDCVPCEADGQIHLRGIAPAFRANDRGLGAKKATSAGPT